MEGIINFLLYVVPVAGIILGLNNKSLSAAKIIYSIISNLSKKDIIKKERLTPIESLHDHFVKDTTCKLLHNDKCKEAVEDCRNIFKNVSDLDSKIELKIGKYVNILNYIFIFLVISPILWIWGVDDIVISSNSQTTAYEIGFQTISAILITLFTITICLSFYYYFYKYSMHVSHSYKVLNNKTMVLISDSLLKTIDLAGKHKNCQAFTSSKLESCKDSCENYKANLKAST